MFERVGRVLGRGRRASPSLVSYCRSRCKISHCSRFHSSNGDINITFNPILDRHADTNLLILRSNQHQVFGLFSGTILLDGTPFQFENVMGFAEKVYNKW